MNYIFTIPKVTTFLSERLSQDPLEKFFGCQRQRGGTNENPNMQQFCKNTQALRVINSSCAHVARGNCRGRKETINWEKENKPLPKRRKSKTSVTVASSGKPAKQSKNPKLEDITVLKVDSEEAKLTEKQCSSEECVKICNDNDLALMKISTGNEPTLQLLIPLTQETSGVDNEVHSTINPSKGHSYSQEQSINQTLESGPADEVLSTGYHISLTRHDLQLLSNGEWLNDKVS